MKKHISFTILIVYNVLTYLVYLYGPIQYEYNNTQTMALLLLLYLIFFSFGYFLTDVFLEKKNKVKSISDKGLISIFIFCSLSSLINSLYFCSVSLPSGVSLLKLPVMIFTEPHVLYYQSVSREGNSSILTQLSTLLSPIFYCAIPLGVILWKKLRFLYKTLFYLVFIFYILSFMLKGTNFGIFVAFLSLLVILYDVNFTKKMMLKFLTISLVPVVFFLSNVYLRVGVVDVTPNILGYNIDVENPIFFLPGFISIPLTIGTSYFTQGYHGFDLALNQNWNLNLGFSRFFIEKINGLVSYDIWKETYQYTSNLEWDMDVYWHTAYVWIANVFGFFGVCIFMLFFGSIFNSIVVGSFCKNDIVNKLLLPLLFLWGLFLPANNVLFSMPYTCMSFLVIYFYRTISTVTYLKKNRHASNLIRN